MKLTLVEDEAERPVAHLHRSEIQQLLTDVRSSRVPQPTDGFRQTVAPLQTDDRRTRVTIQASKTHLPQRRRNLPQKTNCLRTPRLGLCSPCSGVTAEQNKTQHQNWRNVKRSVNVYQDRHVRLSPWHPECFPESQSSQASSDSNHSTHWKTHNKNHY